MDRIKHLNDFQVIEFRRYIIKEGEREHFAEYFELFPRSVSADGRHSVRTIFRAQESDEVYVDSGF